MSRIQSIRVLDHGFVTLRNLSGPTRRVGGECSSVHANNNGIRYFDAHDNDAPNAARMSFNQSDGERTDEDEYKLAKYLIKNGHTSPFEQIQIWLEMKLPIFVARQFVRHRTVRLNEVSGRYVTLPAEWYIPEAVGGKAKSNKQGQEDNLPNGIQELFKSGLNQHCKDSYDAYLGAIDMGVAPEHARLFLHLNHYTHWIWNQDMHNLMHFLSLRDHGHAQIEAQAYAKAIDALIRPHLPKTMELYDEFRRRK